MTKLCNSVLMVAWGAKHKKTIKTRKMETKQTTQQHNTLWKS